LLIEQEESSNIHYNTFNIPQNWNTWVTSSKKISLVTFYQIFSVHYCFTIEVFCGPYRKLLSTLNNEITQLLTISIIKVTYKITLASFTLFFPLYPLHTYTQAHSHLVNKGTITWHLYELAHTHVIDVIHTSQLHLSFLLSPFFYYWTIFLSLNQTIIQHSKYTQKSTRARNPLPLYSIIAQQHNIQLSFTEIYYARVSRPVYQQLLSLLPHPHPLVAIFYRVSRQHSTHHFYSLLKFTNSQNLYLSLAL